MSSRLTNTAAMTALAALTPIEQDLNQIENQVSTGLATMLTEVETAIGSIIPAASTPGATTINLTTERTYVSNPSDSLTTGVGSLVDVNMNEAATKLATLQVQQQLAVRTLRISDSNSHLVLKLFDL
ncbi:MAG: hypothetical protein M3178_12980 [Pseudomonadota bacterium]|nr:hypothetical protein [Pseudomonadota bacterium]